MWMAPVRKRGMLKKEEMIRSSAPAGQKEKLVIITYGTLSYWEMAWEKLQCATKPISQLTVWLLVSLEVIRL